MAARRFFGTVVNILTICSLLACTGPVSRAPVDELDQPPSQKITRHVVARGETLYSIAWRFNLDVNALARANNIREPYTIFPGQEIELDLNRAAPDSAPVSTPVPSAATAPEQQVEEEDDQGRSNSRSNPEDSPSRPADVEGELRWEWPAGGAVIARFDGPQALNQGIDIDAKNGEPVVAAEGGTVVYAGSGLRGYGNLLIIRHTKDYLSAYAHNEKLLVEEGQAVAAGEQIAEVGSSGADRDKLHFEIRHAGTPVDPLRHLPSR